MTRTFYQTQLGTDQLLVAVEDGALLDILRLGDGTDDIGAIYFGKIERSRKGLGGAFVDIGGGQKAFLRTKQQLPEGRLLAVQIQQAASAGKPARVSEKIDYRGAFTVLTPDRPGINQSRAVRSLGLMPEVQAEFEALLPENCGMILRSNARFADQAMIIDELQQHLALLKKVDAARAIGLISKAPTGERRARLEWGDGEFSECNQLPDHILEILEHELNLPRKAAGGTVAIEPTRALIAIDIDTGVNTAPTAGRDVNLAAIRPIIRFLALTGWAGQFVIDTAPMPLQARKGFETTLAKAAKDEGVGMISRGFGPLGLFEGQIKYARKALPRDVLAQIGAI